MNGYDDIDRLGLILSLNTVRHYIKNKTSPITKTTQFYIDETSQFFRTLKENAMGCLYPRKRTIDFASGYIFADKFREINDIISPIIDPNSREEFLRRVRKIRGIEKQLIELKENTKDFYETANAEELAEICKKIGLIL